MFKLPKQIYKYCLKNPIYCVIGVIAIYMIYKKYIENFEDEAVNMLVADLKKATKKEKELKRIAEEEEDNKVPVVESRISIIRKFIKDYINKYPLIIIGSLVAIILLLFIVLMTRGKTE